MLYKISSIVDDENPMMIRNENDVLARGLFDVDIRNEKKSFYEYVLNFKEFSTFVLLSVQVFDENRLDSFNTALVVVFRLFSPLQCRSIILLVVVGAFTL